MLQARNDYVPKYTVSAQPSPRWFMQEIRHLLKCIHTKRCLVKNSHSTSRLAFTFKGIATSTYDSSAQSSSPQNLLHFHHSNTKSLFKHLCLLSSPDKPTQGVINNSSAIHKPCEAELFN